MAVTYVLSENVNEDVFRLGSSVPYLTFTKCGREVLHQVLCGEDQYETRPTMAWVIHHNDALDRVLPGRM